MHVWDVDAANSTAPLVSIAGHKQGITALALRSNIAATASLDGTVREWDLRSNTGKPTTTIQAPMQRSSSAGRGVRAQMRCVLYDPEGTTLVCGSSFPDLLLYSRVAGKPLSAVPIEAIPQVCGWGCAAGGDVLQGGMCRDGRQPCVVNTQALGSVAGEIVVAGATSQLVSFNYLGMVFL